MHTVTRPAFGRGVGIVRHLPAALHTSALSGFVRQEDSGQGQGKPSSGSGFPRSLSKPGSTGRGSGFADFVREGLSGAPRTNSAPRGRGAGRPTGRGTGSSTSASPGSTQSPQSPQQSQTNQGQNQQFQQRGSRPATTAPREPREFRDGPREGGSVLTQSRGRGAQSSRGRGGARGAGAGRGAGRTQDRRIQPKEPFQDPRAGSDELTASERADKEFEPEENTFTADEEDDSLNVKRSRDFDISSFEEPEAVYDRYDATNRVRIIYFGETAEELESQEDHSFVHKSKPRSWMMHKHEKLLDRIERRRKAESVASELVFDDWSFLEDLNLDPSAEIAPVVPGTEVVPGPFSNSDGLVYLEGREALAPVELDRNSSAPDDLLRAPGLLLQEMTTPPRAADYVTAYTRWKEGELKRQADDYASTLALGENIIPEHAIQRMLVTAKAQGIPEEAVRMYADTLSQNRYLTLSEKLLRLRTLSGADLPPRKYWEPRINSVLE